MYQLQLLSTLLVKLRESTGWNIALQIFGRHPAASRGAAELFFPLDYVKSRVQVWPKLKEAMVCGILNAWWHTSPGLNLPFQMVLWHPSAVPALFSPQAAVTPLQTPAGRSMALLPEWTPCGASWWEPSQKCNQQRQVGRGTSSLWCFMLSRAYFYLWIRIWSC